METIFRGNKFCPECRAVLSGRIWPCRNCGAAADYAGNTPAAGEPVPVDASRGQPGPVPVSPDRPAPEKKPARKIPAAIVIGIGIAVIAVLVLVVMPAMPHGSLSVVPEAHAPVVPRAPVPAPFLTPGVVITISNPALETTPVPAGTPVTDPFPDALHVNDTFAFSGGSTAGLATVYRVWMNDTYTWHNDKDNNYYIQDPHAGYKYLFVFLDVYNAGDTRFWPPMSSSVTVHYEGRVFYTDPDHYLPDITEDPRATPIEVKEVQYLSTLSGSEYVEDYGYSHGGELGYLYPGKSNAMDGYLIYEVPASLTLNEAYAVIEFNGKDRGVWDLG